MTQGLQERLRLAREAIKEATLEAIKSAECKELLPGVTVGGGEVFHLPSTGNRNDHSPKGRGPEEGNNDANSGLRGTIGEDEGNDVAEKRAFDLAYSLFNMGTVSVEREMAERLSRVEEELQVIVRAGKGAQSQQPSAAAEDMELDGLDEQDLEQEARSLSFKAEFLRRCCTSRAALEEADVLAISEATDGALRSAGEEGGTLVEAARLIMQADQSLIDAENGIAAAGASGSGSPRRADVDAARRITDSIRSCIRTKRVELQVRAASALDSCVSVNASSISVGNSADGKRSVDGLEDAYEALALLTSADGASASTSEKLDDAILVLAGDIYRLVLEPMMNSFKENVADGAPLKKINMKESSYVGSSIMRSPVHKLEWAMKAIPRDNSSTHKKQLPAENIEENVSIEEAVNTFGNLLDAIRTVLLFVHKHVLLENPHRCNLFGRSLFGEVAEEKGCDGASGFQMNGKMVSFKDERSGRLMKMLVNLAWETCLPSSSSQQILSELHVRRREMCDFVLKFEQDMVQIGFLCSSFSTDDIDTKMFPLGVFVINFERHYAEKRRTSILADGRDLLLKGDYHSTVEVGKDLYAGRAPTKRSPLEFDEEDGMEVFELHKCCISRVAFDLMKLARSTMDSAVEPHFFTKGESATALSILPPTLYRTSRELFDLFRAVIPSINGHEILTVPRTAALLHNDCVYFAHQLLTFGLEYRDRFPEDSDVAGIASNASALSKLCTFVDLVPPFRELADRTMVESIERQKKQLADIVGSRISILSDALRSDEGVVEWTDAETGLTAGAYHLRHLSSTWRPILSRDVYGRAMGNLVDTVLSLYLSQVVVAREVSVAASHFVAALFHDACRKLSDLFASGTSSPDEAVRIAKNFCSLWDKFEAVGKFMDMSLLDISNALSDGVFNSFTGPELTRLITATFTDSDRRKELIKVLSSDTQSG